jgi:protein gp37
MSEKSAIQWTDATWNIARGCTKVDEDCKFCYMYRESMGGTRYEPQAIIRTKTVFDMPLRYKGTKSAAWDGPPLIFTCSLTDFFHEAIDGFRHEAWEIIRNRPDLIFQILTKRPERIIECLPHFWDEIRSRVWLGTSIGSQGSLERLGDLIIPVQRGIKFLSLEPLYGPIDLNLSDFVDAGHKVGDLIDWVIIGGESGNEKGKYRYRPCELEWIEDIVKQCAIFEIPVFVKQMGTHLSKALGMSDRHGGNIDEFPLALRKREFPHLTQTK